ncbi:hypothetical protein [Kribbella sp. DT2]|uniref:hypothetical protein n=1 Tax=Kribbella sp. DT2 TaxID=3393427 RepID=UPI003CF2A887
MKPTEFVKVNTQFWGEHLKSVSEHLPVSHSRELPGPLLYPRLMLLTETPDWNILELAGVSREYRSLEVRRQKAAGIDEYFGTTAGAAAVVALPDESVVKDATIASERGKNALSDSYPATQSLLGNEMVGPSDRLLEFQPGNYAVLDRVLLAQSSGLAVRLKWNFFTIAIHRSEPAAKYLDFLQRLVGNSEHLDPVGAFAVPRGEGVEKALKADQFASTYPHGLAKLTTSDFLTQHEGVLLSAFDATRLIVQPSLESSDGTVTPDFILEREDGSHVVGDLALPLRETGQKHRRSLDLAAGATRLAAYQKYFTTVENQAFAKTKYGVEITDPRTVLVVGTQDSAADFPQAAKTASSVEVVDYDTILRLYLAATSAGPAARADSGPTSIATMP